MEDFDTGTIHKRSAQGIVALVSRAFFLNILSYIASLVIFTYLDPRDFGIYIVVIAIQRVISFFTDFGLGAALIQKKEKVEQSELSTIFSIQALVTFFMFLIIFKYINILKKKF